MKGKFIVIGLAIVVVATTVFLGASAQNAGLVIQSDGSSYQINTTVQFRALYNGQDVTGQAIWAISGAFTNDPRRGDLLAPGQFRLLYGGNDVYVQAAYQGHKGAVGLTVQAPEVPLVRFHIAPTSAALAVNATVQFAATHDPNACVHLSGCPGAESVTANTAWATSDATVLAHTGGGNFKALKAGTATVTGQYQSFTATAVVTVGSSSGSTDPNAPPAPQGMTLEKTLLEMPDHDIFRGNSAGLGEAEWLPGGYFVVSGSACHQYSEDHGTWVFRPDGMLVQERHTCEDSLAPGETPDGLSLWAHAWGLGTGISVVSDTRFIREATGSGHRYPPMLYEVRQSSVALTDKPFSLVGGASTGNPPESYDSSSAPRMEPIAVAKNRLIAKVQEGKKNFVAMYSLPDFTLVKKWENFGTNAEGFPLLINPIVGIGDYIVASMGATGGTHVYRVTDNDLVFVQTLFPSAVTGVQHYSRDPLNPNRIAIRDTGASHASNHKVRIYNVTSSGFVETEVRQLSAPATPSDFYNRPFAIAGDLFAQTFCSTAGCGVEVYRGTTKIAAAVLPGIRSRGAPPGGSSPQRALNSLAFGTEGRLVAVSASGAYLYKIGAGAPPPGPDDEPPPDDPGDGFPTESIVGQYFSATYIATSTAPEVWARYANLLEVGAQSLKINVFGKAYDVNAVGAKILDKDWLATTLADATRSGYINVWGTVDLTTSTLIHARTIRNPILPRERTGQSANQPASQPATTGTGTGSGSNPGTTPSSVTTPVGQNALNALQSILQSLKQRFAQ